jgi:lipoprotein signal peptidase
MLVGDCLKKISKLYICRFPSQTKVRMKARHLILVILAVIFADQALKFYIKLHFFAGEEHLILGHWFRLHFIENEGMAWGWKFGGNVGKIILTLFRLVAVIWGVFILRDFLKSKYHWGFIVSSGLIFAGALGNLLDSIKAKSNLTNGTEPADPTDREDTGRITADVQSAKLKQLLGQIKQT